jgi:hypothetical protein
MKPPIKVVNAADRLTVIERTRIRRGNGFAALMRRGAGVRSNADITPEVRKQLLDAMTGVDYAIDPAQDPFYDAMEKQAIKELEKAVKDSPYKDFLDERNGVAAKSFGRLWALIGDPIHLPNGDDRSVGQLFQYSGVGNPEKREAGKKIHYNPKIGPRLHVIAENAGVKVKGAYYRDVYDAAKLDAQGRLHSIPCAQCGSKSAEQKAAQAEMDKIHGDGVVRLKNDKHAEVGDPWRPGHIDGHAKRIVKREFLRDVWEYTQDL